MSLEQSIIDKVYDAIRVANLELEAEGSDVRISKTLEIFKGRYIPGPSWSGGVCPSCGGLTIRTGTCETCTNCGEASKGCS